MLKIWDATNFRRTVGGLCAHLAVDAVKAKGVAPFMIGTSSGHMALHMIAGISHTQCRIIAASP